MEFSYSGTALPVANGGTASTSVTTVPAATAWAGWDSNGNLTADNFLSQLTSTVISTTPITLTVASRKVQIFTGSGNVIQPLTLPVTSTLIEGTQFVVHNRSSSTDSVVVKSSDGTTLLTLKNAGGASTPFTFTVRDTAVNNASAWFFDFFNLGLYTSVTSSGASTLSQGTINTALVACTSASAQVVTLNNTYGKGMMQIYTVTGAGGVTINAADNSLVTSASQGIILVPQKFNNFSLEGKIGQTAFVICNTTSPATNTNWYSWVINGTGTAAPGATGLQQIDVSTIGASVYAISTSQPRDLIFTGSNSQYFVYMKLPQLNTGQSIRLYNETSIVDSGGTVAYALYVQSNNGDTLGVVGSLQSIECMALVNSANTRYDWMFTMRDTNFGSTSGASKLFKGDIVYGGNGGYPKVLSSHGHVEGDFLIAHDDGTGNMVPQWTTAGSSDAYYFSKKNNLTNETKF